MTRAVLFDVDGTLIDSNDAHARAWVAALSEAGFDVPFARIRPLIGMGGDKILPAVAPGTSDDTEPGKTILQRRLEIFKQQELDRLRPTRGARELFEAVRARGARVVIATSAKQAELDDLLARGELGPLVDVASTSDDAPNSKPDPDIIAAALRKAGVEASDAVMAGDTKYDVEAAHHANVACVALLCGGSDRAALHEADAIYSDPAELMAALDVAPFSW
jgi:HAD superfamily hydrolase (TIGR01549 family)